MSDHNLKDHLAQELVDAILFHKGVSALVRERAGDQIYTTLVMGFGGPGKNNVMKFTQGLERKCLMQRWVPVTENNSVAGWLKVKRFDVTKEILTGDDIKEMIDFLSEDYLDAPDKFNAVMGIHPPTRSDLAVATVVDAAVDCKDGSVLVYAKAGEPILLNGFAARRFKQEANPQGKVIVRHKSGIFRILKDTKFTSFYNTVGQGALS